ncbi:hypothetical protein J6590_028791 [Homalodisca vitripennis]|nr:hypothetical protein J6590_028791 [Homalodisca vitripennis]
MEVIKKDMPMMSQLSNRNMCGKPRGYSAGVVTYRDLRRHQIQVTFSIRPLNQLSTGLIIVTDSTNKTTTHTTQHKQTPIPTKVLGYSAGVVTYRDLRRHQIQVTFSIRPLNQLSTGLIIVTDLLTNWLSKFTRPLSLLTVTYGDIREKQGYSAGVVTYRDLRRHQIQVTFSIRPLNQLSTGLIIVTDWLTNWLSRVTRLVSLLTVTYGDIRYKQGYSAGVVTDRDLRRHQIQVTFSIRPLNQLSTGLIIVTDWLTNWLSRVTRLVSLLIVTYGDIRDK